jgi:hypothetical protein
MRTGQGVGQASRVRVSLTLVQYVIALFIREP